MLDVVSSNVVCSPLLVPLSGSGVSGRYDGQWRHAGHHATQARRGPKTMSGHGRVGQVRHLNFNSRQAPLENCVCLCVRAWKHAACAWVHCFCCCCRQGWVICLYFLDIFLRCRLCETGSGVRNRFLLRWDVRSSKPLLSRYISYLWKPKALWNGLHCVFSSFAFHGKSQNLSNLYCRSSKRLKVFFFCL